MSTSEEKPVKKSHKQLVAERFQAHQLKLKADQAARAKRSKVFPAVTDNALDPKTKADRPNSKVSVPSALVHAGKDEYLSSDSDKGKRLLAHQQSERHSMKAALLKKAKKPA